MDVSQQQQQFQEATRNSSTNDNNNSNNEEPEGELASEMQSQNQQLGVTQDFPPQLMRRYELHILPTWCMIMIQILSYLAVMMELSKSEMRGLTV